MTGSRYLLCKTAGVRDYYYFSHKLGIYNLSEMEEITNLSSHIREKLEKEFDEDMGYVSSFTANRIALYCLIRKNEPETIIETGVAHGISSFLFLKAIDCNGKGMLISIDLPNRNPAGYQYDGITDRIYLPLDKEPGWLVPKDLRKTWKLMIGKSSEVLPKLGNCDLFYHDSEHSYKNMTMEYEWAYQHLSSGGIIGSDDITWNNAWMDFLSNHKDLHPFLDDITLGIAVKK